MILLVKNFFFDGLLVALSLYYDERQLTYIITNNTYIIHMQQRIYYNKSTRIYIHYQRNILHWKNGYYFYVQLLLEEIMKIELKDSSTRFRNVT